MTLQRLGSFTFSQPYLVKEYGYMFYKQGADFNPFNLTRKKIGKDSNIPCNYLGAVIVEIIIFPVSDNLMEMRQNHVIINILIGRW